MLKYFALSLTITLGMLFMSPFVVDAESNLLPEPLVSMSADGLAGGIEATITEDGTSKTIYGGTGANQVVLNHDQNAQDIGFIKSNLDACSLGLLRSNTLPNVASCFLLENSTTSPVGLLTSRSSYNDNLGVLEISALFFDHSLIQGDAFSDFSASNFAFYGRNLNQNHGADSPSNGSWNTGTYSFNPEAQSSFSGEQAQYIKNRVMALANEANTVTAAALNTNGDWYLQGSSISDISNSDASKYPEGKVWIVTQNLSLDATVGAQRRYHGKGTIIFMRETGNPSLLLQSGVQIVPGNKDTDSLGIIMGKKFGNSIENASATLEFQGINTLNAATLVFGSIKKSLPGSVEAIGSFVADSFDGFTAINGFTRFVYDYKFEQNWPPGFRYFDMPQASVSSPN